MNCRILIATLLTVSNTAFANIVGSDHQNFNPGHSFEDYLTVHSARTLGKGHLSLGLGANYAINTLPYYDDSVGNNVSNRFEYNDSLTSVDLGVAVGLLPRLDLFLAAPYIVQQDIQDREDLHGQFDRLGNTELRLGFKVNYYKSQRVSLALVGIANYNRIRNNPYTGNVDWPAHSLENVIEFDFQQVSFSTNIGYRWRHSKALPAFDVDLPISPNQDQWLFSSALEWRFTESDVSTIAEVYGNYSEHDIMRIAPRDTSIVEGLLGLRIRTTDNLYFQFGGGSELHHAISSADQRYFAGLQFKTSAKVRRPTPVLYQTEKEEIKTERIVIEFEDLHFAFDSSALNYSSEREKFVKVRELLSNPDNVELIIIEGHTCEMGSDDYNFALGDRRTDTVMDWLTMTLDIPREKIIPVSYGETKPKASNTTLQGREENRRVRFEITIRK